MMYVMCLFQRLSQYSYEMGASKSDIQVRIKIKNYSNSMLMIYKYLFSMKIDLKSLMKDL